jgi:hypothetical protein
MILIVQSDSFYGHTLIMDCWSCPTRLPAAQEQGQEVDAIAQTRYYALMVHYRLRHSADFDEDQE